MDHKVQHIRNGMKYKKIILQKVLSSLQLPEVLEKYIFTFIDPFLGLSSL